MFGPKLTEILPLVDTLEEQDEEKFVELKIYSFEMVSKGGALLCKFQPSEFEKPESLAARQGKVWFPLSTIRKLGDVLYFLKTMAEEKGLST